MELKKMSDEQKKYLADARRQREENLQKQSRPVVPHIPGTGIYANQSIEKTLRLLMSRGGR